MSERIDLSRKAYKISTKAHNEGGYCIVSARSAGEAKSMIISDMQDAYDKPTYSWIISCRRAPEYDDLAHQWKGCIAWHDYGENWEQDRGSWRDYEKRPMTFNERILKQEAEVWP